MPLPCHYNLPIKIGSCQPLYSTGNVYFKGQTLLYISQKDTLFDKVYVEYPVDRSKRKNVGHRLNLENLTALFFCMLENLGTTHFYFVIRIVTIYIVCSSLKVTFLYLLRSLNFIRVHGIVPLRVCLKKLARVTLKRRATEIS